jgi:hypothetical protein
MGDEWDPNEHVDAFDVPTENWDGVDGGGDEEAKEGERSPIQLMQ